MHASQGSSGTSPHGLVASMAPSSGVGLARLIASRNTSPGSPVIQADRAMSASSAAASSLPRVVPSRGSYSSMAPPVIAARMNSSVTATEMLNRCAETPSSLAWMNARMSG